MNLLTYGCYAAITLGGLGLFVIFVRVTLEWLFIVRKTRELEKMHAPKRK